MYVLCTDMRSPSGDWVCGCLFEYVDGDLVCKGWLWAHWRAVCSSKAMLRRRCQKPNAMLNVLCFSRTRKQVGHSDRLCSTGLTPRGMCDSEAQPLLTRTSVATVCDGLYWPRRIPNCREGSRYGVYIFYFFLLTSINSTKILAWKRSDMWVWEMTHLVSNQRFSWLHLRRFKVYYLCQKPNRPFSLPVLFEVAANHYFNGK